MYFARPLSCLDPSVIITSPSEREGYIDQVASRKYYDLNIQPVLTMSFQLQELLAKFSGVTYGVTGVTAAIVIIAILTRRPNVSIMTKTIHSSLSFDSLRY